MKLPYDLCQQELLELLLAQYPLIFLRSSEESRAINCVIASHQAIVSQLELENHELARWNSREGFQKYSIKPDEPGNANWVRLGTAPNYREEPIIQALNLLEERLEFQASEIQKQPEQQPSQYTYILPDWSTFIKPDCDLTARKLKELVLAIQQKRPRPRMTMIVIGTDWPIPTILRNQVYISDLPLPIGEELYQGVFSVAIQKYNLSEAQARRLSEEAQGMSFQAAAQTAKLITTRKLWREPDKAGQLLLEVKKQEIRKTSVLEYYEPSGKGLEDVGGLENIKSWLKNRRAWFDRDDKPNLRPRAILLEGFPGCGKSFIAKAIAQEWCVPQINFEVSRLQSKWVGESESNTFQALRAIEASAPNILFMDEIEKAFSGVSGDSSGVTTRQFGTFLSWLNDHKYPIFFIATSNKRKLLPPELFRAGRFDEIFIVMPPDYQERYEIIQKKAEIYELPPLPAKTLEFLAENTVGFSGAELEKLVKETVYINVSGHLPTENDWQKALAQIHPQYRSQTMQKLLQNYQKLLDEGAGKPASVIEEGFLESLIDN